jgi:transposase-like protein
MGVSLVKPPSEQFETEEKVPSSAFIGNYPRYCSCPHDNMQVKKIGNCYTEYACDTCGFTYTIDSSD